MRVSTQNIFNVARTSMATANQALSKTQEQMASGKRLTSPADDPVAATQIMALKEQLSRVDQYEKNLTIAENNLGLEETTLDGVTQLTQRLQELAVKAGNTATLTPSEYGALAAEVTSRLDELKDLMNTRNAQGDFIFGGYRASSEPFVGDSNSGFSYTGDQGQLQLQIGDSARVSASDSGAKLFEMIPAAAPNIAVQPQLAAGSGATVRTAAVVDAEAFEAVGGRTLVLRFNEDTAVAPPGRNFSVVERDSGRVWLKNEPFVSGETIAVAGLELELVGEPVSGAPGDQFILETRNTQSLLATADQFAKTLTAMSEGKMDRATLETNIASTLGNLRNAQEHVTEAVATIGARVNTIEATRDMHVESKLMTQKVLSQLESLDYAEAATRLSEQSLILQAAQQSFLRVSQLNLFDRM